MAHAIQTTFALTLYIQKEKCTDTPCMEGRCRGTRRPDDICLDTLRPEGKIP